MLVLLIPANLAPLMTAHRLGTDRSSVLASAIVSIWRGGWLALALLPGAFGIALPFLPFGMLMIVRLIDRRHRVRRHVMIGVLQPIFAALSLSQIGEEDEAGCARQCHDCSINALMRSACPESTGL